MDIRVKKITVHEAKVEVVLTKACAPDYRGGKEFLTVKVDDKYMGLCLPWRKYPKVIKVITFELTNGEFVAVADRKVKTCGLSRNCYARYQRGGRTDLIEAGSGWVGVAHLRAELPGGVKLDYERASWVRTGQLLKKSQKLRLDLRDGCVTDGYYRFPLSRPVAWRRYPRISFAKEINRESWALFLQTIIGREISEVIHVDHVKREMREARRRRRVLEKARVRMVGSCFAGRGKVQSVAIGENLLFTVQTASGPRFVVDSPNYASALYVFDDRQVARDWAARRIDWRTARQKACYVRIHRGDWERDVAATLA